MYAIYKETLSDKQEYLEKPTVDRFKLGSRNEWGRAEGPNPTTIIHEYTKIVEELKTCEQG